VDNKYYGVWFLIKVDR